jgi:hypothetical protein
MGVDLRVQLIGLENADEHDKAPNKHPIIIHYRIFHFAQQYQR